MQGLQWRAYAKSWGSNIDLLSVFSFLFHFPCLVSPFWSPLSPFVCLLAAAVFSVLFDEATHDGDMETGDSICLSLSLFGSLLLSVFLFLFPSLYLSASSVSLSVCLFISFFVLCLFAYLPNHTTAKIFYFSLFAQCV